MARRMETRRCAVCGKPFQASVEGHRTKCDEHKGNRTRRDVLQSRLKNEPARAGTTCTVVVGANGRKCGKPAVRTFRSGSQRFGECAEHAVGGR